MKNITLILTIVILPLILTAQNINKDSLEAVKAFDAAIARKIANAPPLKLDGKYTPDWESIKQYQIPGWYKDAKFGIFIHWYLTVVPEYVTEWYGFYMYKRPEDLIKQNQQDTEWATVFDHHKNTYGPQNIFGYKDLIPLFKAEKFNPDEWMELFVKSGAKYVMPVAEHHDGYPMYNSSFSLKNAANSGPERDVIAELHNSADKYGLKFGVSSHRAWNWKFFEAKPEFDISEPNPDNWNLYWKPHDTESEPSDQFVEEQLYRTVELIDNYKPDILYFDAGVEGPRSEEFCKKIAAHYYNRGIEWGKDVAINEKRAAFPEGTIVRDIERHREDKVSYPFWQTDGTISINWSYRPDDVYKSPEMLVHTLVDIVSKNGTFLLNITPRADGAIPLRIQDILLEIGAWLDVNGEAIYETRPFRDFGEGPVNGTAEVQIFSHKDIRYTTKGNTLYAVIMGWPTEPVILQLPVFKKASKNAKVTLLGYEEPLKYEIKDTKASVLFPALYPFQRACKYAWVLKFEGFEIN